MTGLFCKIILDSNGNKFRMTQGYVFTTLLSVEHGLSIKFAQGQVGHRKSATTLDVYAKLNNTMKDKAMEVLNDVYSKRLKM